MQSRHLRVLAFTFVLVSCAPDGGPDPALSARADSLAAALEADGAWHGGMLAAYGGDILYRGATGEGNTSAGLPNTADQPFDLYSISKTFTAVVALQMVSEGSLELDATVSAYFPDYLGPGVDRITIHHLLSHRSGMPDYTTVIPNYWVELPQFDPDAIMALVAGQPLEFEPGEAFGYSNSGYVLLARILESVAGEAYPDLLRKRIFEPLGMETSRWVSQPGGEDGVALGYRDGVAVPVETVQMGEAGIVSTLDDVLLFARSLGSEDLLPAELWTQAFTAHSNPEEARRFHPAHFHPYGYGFSLGQIETADGHSVRTASHGGAGAGGSSLLVRVLNGDGTLIVWNNLGSIQPSYPALVRLVAAGIDE